MYTSSVHTRSSRVTGIKSIAGTPRASKCPSAACQGFWSFLDDRSKRSCTAFRPFFTTPVKNGTSPTSVPRALHVPAHQMLSCSQINRSIRVHFARRAPAGREHRCRSIYEEGHGVAPTGSFQESEDEAKEHVMASFRWPAALGGSEVSVIGGFTNWGAPVPMLRSPETGDFVRSISLPCDTYQYKFVVDGEWKNSPCDPISGDGLGNFNNQRTFAPSATFTWQANWGGSEVLVAGNFTAWVELLPTRLNDDSGEFTLTCSLPPGTYWYKFLVDGVWMTSPNDPTGPDDEGHYCNKVTVSGPSAYHIYYATGWESPILYVRPHGLEHSPYKQGWRVVPMMDAPSRASPSGGTWKMAVIPATISQNKNGNGNNGNGNGTSHHHKLDFWISDGRKGRDVPPGQEAYTLPYPGGYKLIKGRLTPFPRATMPPIMLVSDLDGTMVADGEVADAATQEFTNYWEDNAALCGSILVYNTGRSLGQFMYLWRQKQGALALPDVLITAVGTKVWQLDDKDLGRERATGAKWVEDEAWSNTLDYGWDLQKVKAVASKIVDQNSATCHWLDDGSEHRHRIALSVQNSMVDPIIALLQDGFQKEDVKVRIITSGTGDWRYVDCVSLRSGKLEALEYVRTLYNIPRERCIAAGDSGNDILMLEGKNRAIVVGNAQPELVHWLVNQPQSDNRVVYTSAKWALGILEGIARHSLF